MIQPGRDGNYPTSSGTMNAGTGSWAGYMPHGIVGLALVAIIILIAWHLMFGKTRRKR